MIFIKGGRAYITGNFAYMFFADFMSNLRFGGRSRTRFSDSFDTVKKDMSVP
jgi:hypothetical protein